MSIDMPIKISPRIKEKLHLKHRVEPEEVWECFLNRQGGFLEDTRLEHKTEPPTLWFIAETNAGKFLKIVFIEYAKGKYELKTAYEPNPKEVIIYEKLG